MDIQNVIINCLTLTVDFETQGHTHPICLTLTVDLETQGHTHPI